MLVVCIVFSVPDYVHSYILSHIRMAVNSYDVLCLPALQINVCWRWHNMLLKWSIMIRPLTYTNRLTNNYIQCRLFYACQRCKTLLLHHARFVWAYALYNYIIADFFAWYKTAFCSLMLLVGWREGHVACKNCCNRSREPGGHIHGICSTESNSS